MVYEDQMLLTIRQLERNMRDEDRPSTDIRSRDNACAFVHEERARSGCHIPLQLDTDARRFAEVVRHAESGCGQAGNRTDYRE